MNHTGKVHSHLFSSLSGSPLFLHPFHLCEFLLFAHVKRTKPSNPHKPNAWDKQVKCRTKKFKQPLTIMLASYDNLFGRIQSGLWWSCAATGMISFFWPLVFCLRKGVSQGKCLTKNVQFTMHKLYSDRQMPYLL